MAGPENPTNRQAGHAHGAEPVFVQVVASPSIGVEVTTGTAWVGVDRQVGHGSADALFALTPHQYAQAMTDPEALWPFMQECWRGAHEDLLLHAPAGGSFRPRHWHPVPFHLLVHERGACLHIGDGRILRLELPSAELADVTGWPQNHDEVRALLGDPVDSYDGDDLHLLPGAEVLVRPAPDDLPGPRIDLVAHRRGTSIASRFFRWRSGEVTAFLDVLGRGSDDPLVDHVRGIAGVTVRERGGVVVAVDLDVAGGALPTLLDGMPAEPRRSDIRFGAPRQYGRHDDLWDFEQGWIHARSGRHGRIESVTVCLPDELPARLHVRPWRFGRDSMDAWRMLSS